MIWLLLLTGCGLSPLSDLVDLSEIAENGGSGGNQSSDPDADDGLDMDCPEDVDVFTEQVWTPVLGQQCVGCHVAGGVAAGTQMVLDPDDMLASLRASAGVADRLVAKPTGQHADGHGGGVLLQVDDEQAQALSFWVGWVGGDCAVPEATACEDAPGPRRIWRLTHSEYDRTILDLVGVDLAAGSSFASDVAVDGYRNDAEALTVSSLLADQYRTAAEDIASALTVDDLLPCSPTEVGATTCAVLFIDDFGQRAFRRPLNQDEIERYAVLWAEVAVEDGFDEGARWVVTAMLQSPHFLYRSELGLQDDDGLWALTDWEIASELSYLLWGTMPDAALLAAAQEGTLRTQAQIRTQVERMAADPRTLDTAAEFVRNWLHLDLLQTVSREGLTDELRSAMIAETDFLVAEIAQTGGTLEDLMLARVTRLDETLAEHYGYESTGWVALDGETGGGLLAQGSLLTIYALASGSSPIHRGVLVRERMLCEDLPPPPAELDTSPPEVDLSLSTRERYAEHSANPACSSCHNKIDPIGFGFEHFDGLGRYREVDGVHTVDASGDVDGAGFVGLSDLSELLLDDARFRSCFVQTWRRWGTGGQSCADDPGDIGLTAPMDELTERVAFRLRSEPSASVDQASLAVDSELSEALLLEIAESLGDIDTGGGGTEGVELELVSAGEWTGGFCMNGIVTNHGSDTVVWEVRGTVSGTITSIWNAEYSLDGSEHIFSGVDWNAELAPGSSTEFGFCGDS
jgi:hypothetical protein